MKMTAENKLHLILLNACNIQHLKLISEHKFSIKRKFRFDYAIESRKLAFEFEGGVWTNGGHTRGKVYNSNCDKYNLAQLEGWKVYRFTCDHFTAENFTKTQFFIENAIDRSNYSVLI
ncbi:MAG: hypothetical protein ACYDEI_00175 [Erysipelotrichaceae bacterium]